MTFCQAASRSGPASWDAVTGIFRPPSSISARGLAARLWYQPGLATLPAADATISQASSPSRK